MMRSPVRKNHNGLIYERDQPDQKELDAGAAQSSMRAGGQHRPDLRRAARRAAHPARADEKLRWDGLRGHARSLRAVWIVQTGCGPAHVLRPALLGRIALLRVGPHGSSLGHGERKAGGGMRRWLPACLGRKRPRHPENDNVCESRPPFKRRETLVDERNYIWKVKNHELNLSLDSHSVARPSWWDTLV